MLATAAAAAGGGSMPAEAAGGHTPADIKRVLRSSIQAARFVKAVVNESEGSDHWYASVPSWIRYARVPAMRYRFVYKVVEPSDRLHMRDLGHDVAFHTLPGAPGWAEELGPVAILYSGPCANGKRWFVFRKLLPFPGQSQEKAPLLLGLDMHVRTTPRDISRYVPGASSCTVLVANGRGELSVPVEQLTEHERYRFWLAWSHPSHAHAKDVGRLRVPRGVDSAISGVLARLKAALLCGGAHAPAESWRSQPYTLIEPQYAEQLGARIGRLLEQRRQLQKAELKRQEHRHASAGAARGRPAAGGAGAAPHPGVSAIDVIVEPAEDAPGALLHA